MRTSTTPAASPSSRPCAASASHDIVEHALTALRNLDHRGAAGAEPDSGDGAGILIQVPDAFLREVVDFDLPSAGAYAVGTRVPADGRGRARRDGRGRIEQIAAEEGLTVLGWRDVPVDRRHPRRDRARRACRTSRQLFVAVGRCGRLTGIGLDRLAFCLRKRAEHETDVYFPSLSSRTLVYKGMLTTAQLEPFFPDLSTSGSSPRSPWCTRGSRPTPSRRWPLAHPYRFIAHNGEINTVKGNRNWMRAREALLTSDLIPGDLERLFPICTPEASDSASLRRGARAAAPRRPLAARTPC